MTTRRNSICYQTVDKRSTIPFHPGAKPMVDDENNHHLADLLAPSLLSDSPTIWVSTVAVHDILVSIAGRPTLTMMPVSELPRPTLPESAECKLISVYGGARRPTGSRSWHWTVRYYTRHRSQDYVYATHNKFFALVVYCLITMYVEPPVRYSSLKLDHLWFACSCRQKCNRPTFSLSLMNGTQMRAYYMTCQWSVVMNIANLPI